MFALTLRWISVILFLLKGSYKPHHCQFTNHIVACLTFVGRTLCRWKWPHEAHTQATKNKIRMGKKRFIFTLYVYVKSYSLLLSNDDYNPWFNLLNTLSKRTQASHFYILEAVLIFLPRRLNDYQIVSSKCEYCLRDGLSLFHWEFSRANFNVRVMCTQSFH